MSYFGWALLSAGGLGMAAVGVWRRKKWEIASGCCFIGVAVFGYLSRFNETYSYMQLLFAIASLACVLINIFTFRKSG